MNILKKGIKKVIFEKDRFMKRKLPLLFYRSRFMAGLYYLLFNKAFGRELQAVLAGKIKHIREAEKVKANYFLLVRNVHRIEKGLLMRPRKPVFGRDYIVETVNSFEGICKNNGRTNDDQQMKWFHDVLGEYFDNSGKDRLIEKESLRFRNSISLLDERPSASGKSIPYYRPDYKDADLISYDDFYKLTRRRRSVRWFKDKPVPRDLIDKAILAANQSPSACNRQPYEFRVIDQPNLVKEVVQFPMGTQGYGHTIPVMIIVVGNLDAYFDERDRHIIYIDGSLASMSFMLALETLGLSSCAINWPDIEEREKKMEKFLRLEDYQRPIMCIGVGYPDETGMVAFSEKRSLDTIRKYNL